MASSAFAQQEKISIDSIRVLNTSPDFVEVELSGFYDGPMGRQCFGVMAKSTDGTMRSSGFQPVIAPGGGKFRVRSQVMRPSGSARQQTDVLVVIAYHCGQDVTFRRKFDWPHVWPEKKPNPQGNENDGLAWDKARPDQVFSQNLLEEDFSALDLLMKKWNDPRERDQNGEWKLNSFRAVFTSYAGNDRDWKGDLQRIQRWRAFNPKSAGAAIAEAKYWVGYAWRIRGNDPGARAEPVALRVFGERMQRAEQALKDVGDVAVNNPLWYEAYLDIAVATKRDGRFIEALFNEAVRRHPYFQPLYLDMAKRWASREAGQADWARADEVIRQAAANTAKMDGSANYALLYAQLGTLQECDCNLFGDSRLSWARMREAFEDLVQRYPSIVNLNAFAAYACRADDKSAFLKVRPLIADRIVQDVWLRGYSHDLCDRRFMQGA